MALKGDRWEIETDLSMIVNVAVEQGQFLSYSTSGSGINLDDSNNVATLLTTSPSGTTRIAGLCLTEVVSLDTTRYQVNRFKDQVTTGSHVTLLRKGWVVNNKLMPGLSSVTGGQKLFVGPSGLASNVMNQNTTQYAVGQFEGAVDADGYAKMTVLLPALV